MLPKKCGRAFAGLIAVMLVAGCASTQTGPTPSVAVPQTAPPQVGTTPTPDPRVTTLNGWILSRGARGTATTDLPLGPGDVIVVNVFLVSELSQLKVRIPTNGAVALPLIGVVPASGRTARDLEDAVKARLRTFMHDPQVSIFIEEHKSQQIAVFGSVKAGGVYPLVSHLRVTDALALAGALNEDADHVVYLIRRSPAPAASPRSEPRATPAADQPAAPAAEREVLEEEITTIPIDLETVLTGRQDLNLPLKSGDVIQVPRAGSYYVGGDVIKPGSFLLKGKTTLHHAIVNAGGVKPTADWDDIRLYRVKSDGQWEVSKYSLNDLEERPGSQGIEIHKNDVVVLGQSGLKVFGYGILNFIKFGVGASIPF